MTFASLAAKRNLRGQHRDRKWTLSCEYSELAHAGVKSWLVELPSKLIVLLDITENYVELGEIPRPTSAEPQDEAITGGQPEPVRPPANRDHSRGATDAGKRKGKTAKRDGDPSKVTRAIDPERYTAHSTTERNSLLDWNDSRETFGWVRSVHDRDPEGLYLKVSQLRGKEFIIWPNEHDTENNSN
ncbi:hypothetical protein ARMSODRAFT_982031 [Armillaria solidipes]|uniref:Uncharacterized protein n=1 Tax=Armillaria solidipes TaxID=1076256 RepID=A0A2H3B153_9AGAR|nr:hypothetical protein ARMSODRAFT_982031 [Armillaria solidipes]